MSAAGLFVLGFASPTMPIAMILLGFSLVGLGNGQTTAPSTTLIMGSVPRAKAGVGSAVNDLSREMGGALGIAVLGSVMASLYRGDIVHRLASLPPGTRDAAKSSIVATFDAAQRSDPSTAHFLVEQGKAAFSHAFGMAMLVGAAVILLNSLIVWTFQHRGRTADLPLGRCRSRRAGDVAAVPGRPRRRRHAPGGSGVAPVGAVATLVGDGSMARARVLRSPPSPDVTPSARGGVGRDSPPRCVRLASQNLDARWQGWMRAWVMTWGNPPRHRLLEARPWT